MLRRLSLPVYLFFWSLLIAMFFGLIVNQAGTYNELSAELERINADIARELDIYYDLSSQLLFFDNYAHMEMLARNLGMIRHNQMIIVNVAD